MQNKENKTKKTDGMPKAVKSGEASVGKKKFLNPRAFNDGFLEQVK